MVNKQSIKQFQMHFFSVDFLFEFKIETYHSNTILKLSKQFIGVLGIEFEIHKNTFLLFVHFWAFLVNK